MMIKIVNMLKNLKKDDKGFTLIELMVVIAVLGILAALIIPQFSGVSDKARKANTLQDVQAIATAASMFYTEKGTNPSWSDLGSYMNTGKYSSSNFNIDTTDGVIRSTVFTDVYSAYR